MLGKALPIKLEQKQNRNDNIKIKKTKGNSIELIKDSHFIIAKQY